jgi:hypothetical protein
MEPASFLLVAQGPNQLLHRVPQPIVRTSIYLNKRVISELILKAGQARESKKT